MNYNVECIPITCSGGSYLSHPPELPQSQSDRTRAIFQSTDAIAPGVFILEPVGDRYGIIFFLGIIQYQWMLLAIAAIVAFTFGAIALATL